MTARPSRREQRGPRTAAAHGAAPQGTTERSVRNARHSTPTPGPEPLQVGGEEPAGTRAGEAPPSYRQRAAQVTQTDKTMCGMSPKRPQILNFKSFLKENAGPEASPLVSSFPRFRQTLPTHPPRGSTLATLFPARPRSHSGIHLLPNPALAPPNPSGVLRRDTNYRPPSETAAGTGLLQSLLGPGMQG